MAQSLIRHIERGGGFSQACLGEYPVVVPAQQQVGDSAVLPKVMLGRPVPLKRANVHKGCVLPDGFKVGGYPNEDRAYFHVTEHGVTLIASEMVNQGIHSPAHTECGIAGARR